MSKFDFQYKTDHNIWECKYCKMKNKKYEELCKRCGKGVAPELFLPPRHASNPIIMIVFFFILVMIIVFSKLPAKNMKHLITHYKTQIENKEAKIKN